MINHQANKNTGGLIVTFNPRIEMFERVLAAISAQVSILVIVDNASRNVGEIDRLCLRYNFKIIKNHQNLGMAKALNIGVSELRKNLDIEWVLFIDQDTILQNDYVLTLLENLYSSQLNTEDIWVVRGTEIYTGKPMTKNKKSPYKKIKGALLSGSLVKINALKDITFRDDFFVDLVDTDFYNKIRKSKHYALSFNKVYIIHSLGTTINLQGRPTTYHNGPRTYLATRNATVLLMEGFFDFRLLWFTIVSVISLIYMEGIKESLLFFSRGIFDGFLMKIHSKTRQSANQFWRSNL